MTTVLANARIFSAQLNAELTGPTCLVIEDSKIAYIGSDEHEICQKALNEGAERVDLQGKIVSPGFIDGYDDWLVSLQRKLIPSDICTYYSSALP